MAKDRINKINEEVRRAMAEIIRELKDTRIPLMTSVVAVSVTNDLSYAKVYVSDIKGIDSAKEAVKGLTAATGYIRREVGGRLHLRKTPELKFVADDSIEQGFNMFKVLEESQHRGDGDDN